MGKVTNISDKQREREMEEYPEEVEIFCVEADLETGEADIDWFDEFDAIPPLMQMDLLNDVLEKVQARYQQALHEFGGTH